MILTPTYFLIWTLFFLVIFDFVTLEFATFNLELLPNHLYGLIFKPDKWKDEAPKVHEELKKIVKWVKE